MNSFHLTDLCDDVLVKCCQYLAASEVSYFAQTSTRFSIVARDCNAVYELLVRPRLFIPAIKSRRNIKSLKLMLDRTSTRILEPLPSKWFKKLEKFEFELGTIPYFRGRDMRSVRNVINAQLTHRLFTSNFENLSKLRLSGLQPRCILHRMYNEHVLQLKYLELSDIPVTHSTIGGILKCQNLETLIMHSIEYEVGVNGPNESVDDMIQSKIETKERGLIHLKKIQFDIVSALILRPFFYWILRDVSPSTVLRIGQKQTVWIERALHPLFKGLFSLEDEDYGHMVEEVLFKLKHLRFNKMDEEFLLPKNIGHFMVQHDNLPQLETFEVDITIHDIGYSCMVNSINIHESLDLILKNSESSKLRCEIVESYNFREPLNDFAHKLMSALVEQFVNSKEGTRGFGEMQISSYDLLSHSLVKEFIKSLSIGSAIGQNQSEISFDSEKWAIAMVDGIIASHLMPWANLSDQKGRLLSAVLHPFGIYQFELVLDLLGTEGVCKAWHNAPTAKADDQEANNALSVWRQDAMASLEKICAMKMEKLWLRHHFDFIIDRTEENIRMTVQLIS